MKGEKDIMVDAIIESIKQTGSFADALASLSLSLWVAVGPEGDDIHFVNALSEDEARETVRQELTRGQSFNALDRWGNGGYRVESVQ